MKVINKTLLREFRAKTRCEYCREKCQGADCHHIFGKGAGRVDVRCNLIALCRECHQGFHACNKPSRHELLAIAAEREGTTPEEIEATVHRFRRDQRCKVWEVG